MTRSSADANWVLLIKPVSALWVAWWPPTLPSSSSSPPSSPWSQTASSSYSWRLAKDNTFYKKNLAPFPFLCNLPVIFFWVIPTTMLHHHPLINHVIIRICNLTHIAWWWKSKHSPLSRPAAQHTCFKRGNTLYSIQCISVRSTAAGRMIQRGVFGDKKVTSKRISLLHFTISYDKEMHSRSAHCCTRTVRCKGQEMYKCPVQSMQVHICTKQSMHSVTYTV